MHQDGTDPQLSADVYERLRGLAHAYMSHERSGHTLQPTALVHEAFLRISQNTAAEGGETRDIVPAAAMAMRRLLVESARRRNALKRGGRRMRVPLDDLATPFEPEEVDLLELDRALERLSKLDEQLARIVDLRFFAGMSTTEIAEVLDVSTRTVERGWRFARLWLYRDLDAEGAAHG